MYTYFILQLDVPVIDGCLFVWLFYIYLTVTFFNKNIICAIDYANHQLSHLRAHRCMLYILYLIF